MTEFPQDITPRPEKTPKKPKKLTKKEASEYMAAIRLEHTTTPDTDPDEALKRIDRVVKYIELSEDPLITQARQEMLRRVGYNPDEWISYRNVKQPKDRNKGFTDEDMQEQFGRYPKELEFIVVQGEPRKTDQYPDYLTGKLPPPYMLAEDVWVGFIRKRPENTQIESPKKPK